MWSGSQLWNLSSNSPTSGLGFALQTEQPHTVTQKLLKWRYRTVPLKMDILHIQNVLCFCVKGAHFSCSTISSMLFHDMWLSFYMCCPWPAQRFITLWWRWQAVANRILAKCDCAAALGSACVILRSKPSPARQLQWLLQYRFWAVSHSWRVSRSQPTYYQLVSSSATPCVALPLRRSRHFSCLGGKVAKRCQVFADVQPDSPDHSPCWLLHSQWNQQDHNLHFRPLCKVSSLDVSAAETHPSHPSPHLVGPVRLLKATHTWLQWQQPSLSGCDMLQTPPDSWLQWKQPLFVDPGQLCWTDETKLSW